MEATHLAPKKEISVIPAVAPNELPTAKHRQLRVAAYCRVSTDKEDQLNSYEAQIDYYTEKIMTNPEWTMAGIFADEGITGTSTRKRKDFKRMIEKCKKGKIDVILVKNISRFARNTVDCLNYIRTLKAMKISVIFEKENMDTMKIANEMFLTMLGCFAQSESESISSNVKFGKRQSMKNGNVIFVYKNFLGYEKGEDGQPKIIPQEAEIVKRIYDRFLAGQSIGQIKKDLDNDGIYTKKGCTEWSPAVISRILQNEKYAGDSILQKTYVEDVLTKKVRKNNGELPKVFVKNSHVAIISREVFSLAQQEMAKRNGRRKVSEKNAITELGKYSSKYALTDILVCGDCGTPYRRKTWSKNGVSKGVWRCINRLDYGTKYCKKSPTLDETELQAVILDAINDISEGNSETLKMVVDNLRIAISDNDTGSELNVYALKGRIDELNKEMLELSKLGGIDGLEDRFINIAAEIKKHKDTIALHEANQAESANLATRMSRISDYLETDNPDLTVWNEQIVRHFIHTIKVLSKNKLLIIFKGGIEIEKTI